LQRFIKILRAFQRKDITKSLALKCIVLTNDLENKSEISKDKPYAFFKIITYFFCFVIEALYHNELCPVLFLEENIIRTNFNY